MATPRSRALAKLFYGVSPIQMLSSSNANELPRDSSNLESLEGGGLTKQRKAMPREELKLALEKQLPKNSLPRYYVAACFKQEDNLEETLPGNTGKLVL